MEKDNQIIPYLLSRPLLLLFASGLFPIIFALISQYGFGLHPCELCIYQRIPFAFIATIAFLAALVKNPSFTKLVFVASVLAFLVNSGIAFFHVGVEEKWWEYGECSAELDMSSVEALTKALFEAPSVRCDDVQFRFFGLSMAGWNVVYSIIAAIFFLNIFRRRK